MSSQAPSYERFKELRKAAGKKCSRDKYAVFIEKWALAQVSDSEEEISPIPKKVRGLKKTETQSVNKAISQFENALVKVGEAENGATQLSRAQALERKNAPWHRRSVYGKYGKKLRSCVFESAISVVLSLCFSCSFLACVRGLRN